MMTCIKNFQWNFAVNLR